MAKHCFANLVIGENHIELTDILQISNRIPLSKYLCQMVGKTLQNLLPVCGTILSLLFFLHNFSADFVVLSPIIHLSVVRFHISFLLLSFRR